MAGFWSGVSDWLGLEPLNTGNVGENIGNFFQDALRIIMAPTGFGKAWADGPGGYTGGDAWRDGFTTWGPIGAGIKSAWKNSGPGKAISEFSGQLTDVVNDLSDQVSSLSNLEDLDTALADILQGKSSSDLVNALMAYFTSPGAEAENQREFNREEADLAVDRARLLRRTQYQDAVESLKAAGLNPVLAAGGGIGGSSSTAPMATSTAAQGTRAVDMVSSIALLLSAITGSMSDLAEAFGKGKTSTVNKTVTVVKGKGIK